MKLFYDHLIIREEVHKELKKCNLLVEEHIEIMRLTDEAIHLEVLDVILASLPEEKHKEFLEEFHGAPHNEKLLEYLNPGIESKIKERAKKVKEELFKEIKKSKKK